MAVYLSDEQELEVDGDDLLAIARYVLGERAVPRDMELTLLLVDEPVMATLNATHMGAAGPTDVLAFPMDEPGTETGDVPEILGDVVLCPRLARRQAEARGRALQEELRLLTVHGVLHLLGMDHAEPAEEREMFSLTDELLVGYGATVHR